jgi:hypothetical protein
MPTPDIKTLILRFRDLSTSPGETIAFHQQVIAKEKKSVWWGWWNKEGETIPDEAFRKIAKAASAPGGLTVLLFHSDQQQIFEAHCVKLFWDNEHQLVLPSEDPELVPEYYKGRPCLAWFRFTSIQPQPNPGPSLQKLSYVEVPEFFTGGDPGYQLFDGKVIASAEELRQQNRTIWFVRDARPEDRTHEIKVFDSHQIEPSDFPKEHIVSSSTDLLWVSDLHFSEDGLHAFSLKTSPTGGRSAWDSIKHKLDDLGIENVAGVIASGDFAWKASPAEFSQARTSFFDAALDWSKELSSMATSTNRSTPRSAVPSTWRARMRACERSPSSAWEARAWTWGIWAKRKATCSPSFASGTGTSRSASSRSTRRLLPRTFLNSAWICRRGAGWHDPAADHRPRQHAL